jgi:hypothetical protein
MPMRQQPENERMRPAGIALGPAGKVIGLVAVALAVVIAFRIWLGPGGGRWGLALVMAGYLAWYASIAARRDPLLGLRYDLLLGLAELLRWPIDRRDMRWFLPYRAKLPGQERVTSPVDPADHVQFEATAHDTHTITRVRLWPLPLHWRLRRPLTLTFDAQVAAAIDADNDARRRELERERAGRRLVLRSRRAYARLDRPRRCLLMGGPGPERLRRLPAWPRTVTAVTYTRVPPAFPWAERRLLDKIAQQTGALLGGTYYVRPPLRSGDSVRRQITCRRTLPLPDTLDYDELPEIDGMVVLARAEPDPENSGITWHHDASQPLIESTAYVAFDPNEYPHGRVHGPTGRGKTVLLRAFVHAWWRYGAHLVLIDGKRAGSFVFFTTAKFKGRCSVPGNPSSLAADIDAKLDALRTVYTTLQQRQETLELARIERAVLLDEGVPERELPPLPRFEPLTVIIDEWRALARDAAMVDEAMSALDKLAADASGQPVPARADFLRTFAAQVVQLGRELGVFLYLASQSAQVEGVGGAKLDSETRSQFTLVCHLGPVGNASDAGTVFGQGEGIGLWAMGLDLKPYGRGGAKLGDALIRCHYPYSHDPLAALSRADEIDQATRYSSVLARVDRERGTAARTGGTTTVLDRPRSRRDDGDTDTDGVFGEPFNDTGTDEIDLGGGAGDGVTGDDND